MQCIGMAVLAQIRGPYLEKIGVGCAVGIVAVGATIAHRGMFPQEWPALFGMAFVTGFIDRGGLEQTGAFAAMRVMAAGTFFGALCSWHHGVQGMFHLRPFGLVTGEAHPRAHRVSASMNVMAIGTTDSSHIVRAAAPTGMAFIVFVTSQTKTILLGGDSALLE